MKTNANKKEYEIGAAIIAACECAIAADKAKAISAIINDVEAHIRAERQLFEAVLTEKCVFEVKMAKYKKACGNK